MGWDAPWHWIVLAVVVIALFGYKRLPDAARSVGRSLRIFKSEIKGMGDDDAARQGTPAVPAPTPPQQAPATPTAAPSAPAPAPTAEQSPAAGVPADPPARAQ